MAHIGYKTHTTCVKSIAQNRRARFDYDIADTIEAGIILTGQEVKSCRAGHANLSGSYLSFHQGKPILKHMKISPYAFASGLDSYNPDRDRELLLKKSDVVKLQSLVAEKGITVIPLEVKAGKFIKIVIGVGKGRKTIDKRARIKERDVERKMKRGEEV